MNTIQTLDKVYDFIRKFGSRHGEPDYRIIGEIAFKIDVKPCAFAACNSGTTTFNCQ